MHVTFYGAVREVTGSMHLLSTENDRILLDCGLFQGHRRESNQKNRVLPFDPKIITNMLLSHAHIDHSGRIPMLTRKEFHGRVICTRATADACEYLLPDSAHIQESDANYLNYKTVRSSLARFRASILTNGKNNRGKSSKKVSKRELNDIKKLLKKDRHQLNVESINDLMARYHLKSIQPLYTLAEAENALGFFDSYPYGHPVTIGKEMSCTFYEAGHILGSALTFVRARENGRTFTICYTGDIGRFGKPILRDPTLNFNVADRNVDLMIMESTYGNRRHEPVEDLKDRLKQVMLDTCRRQGAVLIPSFAFGRTQELIYVLHKLYDSGEVPRIPVYVDSPLATNLTRVFGEHPEVYDRETQDIFLRNGKNPFMFKQIRFIGSVEESIDLMKQSLPHVVIASSGMCEAGRILHHLRYKIHNPKNTILIVGYMAQNTLGHRILEKGEAYEASGRTGPPPMLRFLNKEYPLKAHVAKIGGFSGHADREEMRRFLKQSDLNIKRIALVHGEEEQTLSFADCLKQDGYNVTVPRLGETLAIR
ncbi:MBL fold hydrolase [Desulfonema ishimotonii]|uniref:MBL fold hydrolase n=1 Tax=Desulfonema ishimotonii TaxID=45657 RepID=A0A401FR14_9BACT|nr:MBL fold metallo-hydrolase [Desulfonema ishimotonii]GBC59400.1 MBL fold hydrolase [Desulfonema ishimotonii]